MQNIPNPQQLFDVKDKVAVVTGATGAFGAAAAMGLGKAGAKVMCTARKVETLEPLVQSITEAGFEAIYEAGDPVVHDDVKRVVTKTVEAYGGIDILVTAAGLNKVGAIIEQPVEDWQTVMDVNVKGTYLYCKEVGKVLVEQGRGGKVIIVSSARSSLGMANYTAYSPSKAATDLLAKSLACEWGQYKINVNAIAPTVFRSPLTQWMFEDDAFYKNFLKRIPIGRLGEPEDFIGSVIFLSSKASDFMTGAILAVDGGYVAG
jgi:NAD(P)-dependent dehydrogenase (short-subunit alcohol dehydrogenase family)